MSLHPTIAVVQARMGSTRLPGKVLRRIAGRPMLSYQLERMRRARPLAGIVIASSPRAADRPVRAFRAHLPEVPGPLPGVVRPRG